MGWTDSDLELLDRRERKTTDAAGARELLDLLETKYAEYLAAEDADEGVEPQERGLGLLREPSYLTLEGRLEFLLKVLGTARHDPLVAAAGLTLSTPLPEDDERRWALVSPRFQDDALPWGWRGFLARSFGARGLATVVSMIPRTTFSSLTPIKANHDFLLRHLDDGLALQGLHALYGEATWIQRRVLLASLGEPGHGALLPLLVTLAREAEPTTQRAVIVALARIAHPAAEPLLLEFLSGHDSGLQIAAVRALASVGTRAALGPLHEHTQGRGQLPTLVGAGEDALAQIGERLGLDGESGQLSLAGDGPGGSLSFSDDPAALSLYQSVAAEVTASPIGAAVFDRVTHYWQRVGPPPRRLSTSVVARCLLAGHGWVASGFVILALTIVTAPASLVFGIPVVLFLVIAGGVMARDDLLLIRDGVAALAEPLGMEVVTSYSRKGGTSKSYRYKFRYLDEAGDVQEVDRTFEFEHPEFEDEELEPILYDPEYPACVFLYDELSDVTVDENGQLHATWRAVAWVAWAPILCVVLLVVRIVAAVG